MSVGAEADPYNTSTSMRRSPTPRARREGSDSRRGNTSTARSPRHSRPPKRTTCMCALKAARRETRWWSRTNLWLPGLLKLKMLIDTGVLREDPSVRGEFGTWVFEGKPGPITAPLMETTGKRMAAESFSTCSATWRYVLDNLFGKVTSVSCLGATHIPDRWDEQGSGTKRPPMTRHMQRCFWRNGVVAQFNSSWTVRVRRDDL